MMSHNEAPCLVTAGQGVSVLYKNRHLFSRFAPEKSLKALLDDMSILSNSLVLCLSPVLPFPIEFIKKKLASENTTECFILAVECDTVLHDFFLEHIGESLLADSCAAACIEHEIDIALLLEGHIPKNIQYCGQELPPVAAFRRVIVIEASSEVQQYKAFYGATIHHVQDSITQFWKNRVTLLRLGKLFARNTLKNIATIAGSVPLQKEIITKPTLVVGAGPSLDELIPFIREHRDNVYIVAIAAALAPLFDHQIRPDAIVSVESQLATEKAFIGFVDSGIPLYADISSRPRVLSITGGTVSLFLSEYYASPLLDRIKQSFPSVPVFPPLGSVGLAAIEVALLLRAAKVANCAGEDCPVPIFVCGLDFSFIAGKTHCKGSPHVKEALSVCNKLSPVGNPSAAFRHGAFTFVGKNGIELVSDSALRGYGELLSARYKGIAALYDLSPMGMQTSLPYCTFEQAQKIIFDAVDCGKNYMNKTEVANCDHSNTAKAVKAFYADEAKRLYKIRDILTGKNQADCTDKKSNDAELLAAINDCSYLYLHFPDGHRGAQLRQDFLNRVRSELDVFLKDIELMTKDC